MRTRDTRQDHAFTESEALLTPLAVRNPRLKLEELKVDPRITFACNLDLTQSAIRAHASRERDRAKAVDCSRGRASEC
eukprot:3935127-Rhodomonas_salina.4